MKCTSKGKSGENEKHQSSCSLLSVRSVWSLNLQCQYRRQHFILTIFSLRFSTSSLCFDQPNSDLLVLYVQNKHKSKHKWTDNPR